MRAAHITYSCPMMASTNLVPVSSFVWGPSDHIHMRILRSGSTSLPNMYRFAQVLSVSKGLVMCNVCMQPKRPRNRHPPPAPCSARSSKLRGYEAGLYDTNRLARQRQGRQLNTLPWPCGFFLLATLPYINSGLDGGL